MTTRGSSIPAAIWFVAAVAAIIVASGYDAAADEQATLTISRQVWQYYQEYAARRRPLAFAVSDDGRHAGYIYCDGFACDKMDEAKRRAVALCLQTGGRNCHIFAVYSDIKVPYKVADLVPAVSVAPAPKPALPPKPDCGNKTAAECAAILADFDYRRGALEAKWATKMAEVERRWCFNVNHRPVHCAQMRSEAEVERDAEFRALDQGLKLALGN